MVTISYAKPRPAKAKGDALAVFAVTGDHRPRALRDAAAVGAAAELDLAAVLDDLGYHGDLGEIARLPVGGKLGVDLLLVVGLGQAEAVTTDSLRKAAGAAARAAQRTAALAIAVPGEVATDADDADRAQAVAEGASLGAYAFTAYRTKADDVPDLAGIELLAGDDTDAKAVQRGVETGTVTARAVALCRDLVNEPPHAKRPPDLAERIVTAAKDAGLKTAVRDEKALAKDGFGGIIGVGQGSQAPPRLVELTHDPGRASGHVTLVGKGITFDSGGLSLKTSQGMTWMKVDMAGAASVTAAMTAIATLNPRIKVTGLVPLAENLPSATAYRPSDVLTHYGGTTVEVMNTDAEGRLVLADALAYAAQAKPDAIVDVATLTGAQITALGKKISALMSVDDALAHALSAAADAAGEPTWRLPLPGEYREQLKSNVADLKNIGKAGEAGSVIAGLFLEEFVGDRPWAHFDVAGPAWTDEGDGFYTTKGGTGVPVRTLVRWVLDCAER
jgi:leucyl aminopeptidase